MFGLPPRARPVLGVVLVAALTGPAVAQSVLTLDALGCVVRPLDSSFLVRASYCVTNRNAALGEVVVVMSSGTYAYFDVPWAIFQSMVTADSPGAYFNQNIRDRFAFARR